MKSYTKKIEEVLNEFNSNKEKGLDDNQILKAREKYGDNKLQEEKPETILHMIIGELTGFLNVLLIAAAIISIVASGHLTDGLFIMAIVILNTGLSVFQERRASNAVNALKNMSKTS